MGISDDQDSLSPGGAAGKQQGEKREMVAAVKEIMDQLGKWPAGQGGEFRAAEGDLQVRVKMSEAGRMGCLLETLELKSTSGSFSVDPIRIEKEVNYLAEPLKIVELKKYQGRAILRSFPPRTVNGTVSFFEMVIDRSDGLSLGRLAYNRNLGTRSQTSALLPRDTLERLLADLVSLASNK
jgi:hypothetical protein